MYHKIHQEGDISMFLDEKSGSVSVIHKNGSSAKNHVKNITDAKKMAQFSVIDSKNVDIVCKFWMALADSY